MDQFPADVTAESAANESPAKRFVAYVIERIAKDNGFAARLKRADNPATEYQSWEILAGFGIDLEKEWQRLPYCVIGAALAKAKPAAMVQPLWGPPLRVVILMAISLNRRKLACGGCWPVHRRAKRAVFCARCWH